MRKQKNLQSMLGKASDMITLLEDKEQEISIWD